MSSVDAVTPNPTVPAYTDDLEWVTAYLVAHMLSDNSRRYVYFLWFCIAFVFVFCIVFRRTGSISGALACRWRKWAIRRRTWRGKSVIERVRRTGKPAYPTSLPSNGQIICLVIMPVAALILAFAGPDYVSPKVGLFNILPAKISARAYDISSYVQFQPQYQINKNWWTSGGRTGLIAFGLFPLCILFALKAPPIAIFALPFTTQIHFDKLSWLHRWSGRLIYLLVVLHVALWSVQLATDVRASTGKVGYTYAWQYEKFIYAWIAFGSFTLLIFSSSKIIRKHHYETFYGLHVLLVPLTLVFSALHHPPVWLWCWSALGLWVAERAWRSVWWLQMNGFFGHEKSTPVVTRSVVNTPITPIGSYPPRSPHLDPRFEQQPDGHLLAPATALEYTPPLGYAHAELLSGATIRLTYITPGFLSWAPGQHFLINIPSVSRFLTHPFTTASICDDQAAPSGRAIVFLVRCKNGWTQDLWDHVGILQKKGLNHDPGEKLPNGTIMPARGVLLKMYVDGPFGSSVGTKWGNHSTVVIMAAGSGVSFALSILEYMCLCLAGREGKHLGGSGGGWGSEGFKTQRVRFVWLIREYAHIQWCASIIRRCMSMIPSPALDVDIFVTNGGVARPRTVAPSRRRKDGKDPLAPPNPRFSTHSTTDSLSSDEEEEQSNDGIVDLSYYTNQYGDEDGDGDNTLLPPIARHNFTVDLTDWDDERDSVLAGEARFSRLVQKEGNYLRRMSRAPNRSGAIYSQSFRPTSSLRPDSYLRPESAAIRPDSFRPNSAALSPLPERSSDALLSYYNYGNTSQDRLSVDSRRISTISADSTEMDLGSQPVTHYEVNDPVPRPLYPHSQHSPPVSRPETPIGQTPTSNHNFLSPSPPATPPAYRTHAPMKPSPLHIADSVFDLPAQETSDSQSEKRQSIQSKRASVQSFQSGAPSIHHRDFPTHGYSPSVETISDPTIARLHVDSVEMRDISYVAMNARSGKPILQRIMKDEVERAKGSIIVACCGPTSFNAMVRKAVALNIDPEKVKNGDCRGFIDLVSEEFEF